MLEDGLEKVLEGKTSFDEIIKLIDLEDDLGSGSQLGLDDQLEASRMDTINANAINLGNNPININITPELLNSLNSINNMVKNPEITPINQDTTEKIDNIAENKEIDEPVINETIDNDKIEVLDQLEKNDDNTVEILDDAEQITQSDKDYSTDDIEILKDDSEENDIIIVEEPPRIEILDENDELPPIDELIKKFNDNLNKLGKKKFILKTKEIVADLDKHDVSNEEVVKIVKKYIKRIKNSNKLKISEKLDLIALFNKVFGLNEEIDEIDKLTETSLETIDIIEDTANNIDLSENEIDDILGTKNDNIIKVSIADSNDLELKVIDDTDASKEKKKKKTKKEKLKEVSIDDSNNLEISVIEDKDNTNKVSDIPEITFDDDADFSAIDDSIINSLLDNLGEINEDD